MKIKSKNLKNNILSILLCLVLSFSCILFASCSDIEDEIGQGEKNFFTEYIDSFKVVYSNSLVNDPSVLEPLTNDFFFNTLSVPTNGLAYYYGSADNQVYITNNYYNWFPDSIRMMVVENSTGNAELINNKIWKWTFKPSLEGNNVDNLKPRVETVPADQTYEGWKNRLWNGDIDNDEQFSDDGLYSTTFTNMYLLALKIVMYEILLGYDNLTIFEPATIADLRANGHLLPVAEAQEGLVAKVKTSGETSIVGEILADKNGKATYYESKEANEKAKYNDPESYLNSTKLTSYITKLQNDFLKKTKYIGFTKENADRMINYILNEVIGKDLVLYDYMNFGPSTTNTSYVRAAKTTDDLEIKKDDFKIILGLETGAITDTDFNQYVSTLKKGDVVYNPIGYNYLVYDGASGTGANTTYSFKEYYNYRNYVDRVAEIIYKQTYDTSEDYKFSYDMIYNSVKLTTINYDFVKVNTGLDGKPINQGALARRVSSATAATFLQHFGGELFFEEVSENEETKEYNFKNSPKAEYQSILMVTNEKNVFDIESGIVFNVLAYDRNLKINIKVRYYYYDSNTGIGTLYVFDSAPATFTDAREIFDPTPKANKKGYESDFEVGFNPAIIPSGSKGVSEDGFDTFIIPHVINEEYADFGTTGEINLGKNENKTIADYYKIENSQNGYGGITVVNEKKMKCSFYEIVFDIVKSPDDPVEMDYDFKITVSPFIW